MNKSTACNDAASGPVVEGCRQDFDFTLAFEQYLFTLVPAAIFLLAAPIRIAALRKTPTRVEGQLLRISKLTAIAVFACLQLTLLVLWATQPSVQGSRTTALAASALSLTAGLALLPLSYIEHARSLRPSLVANAYLAVSVLLDAATLRTLWISDVSIVTTTTATTATNSNILIRNVSTVSWTLKILVLVLEAIGKRRFFLAHYRGRSPEESSGLFGQGLLLWLNDIIFYGARHLLRPESLYPISADMASEKLGGRFWELWTKAQTKQDKPSLNKTLFRLLGWPVLLPIFPRLALLGLTLCQPLMLQRLLAYLEDPVQRQDPKIGYALVGATVVIYVGMAISAAVYWHRHYRFMAMLRATLITSVFRNAAITTTITTTTTDAGETSPTQEATNAKTVTLMSADCERITRGLLPLHDLWADISQVAIATYLIETQLGVACVAPIAVTLITTGLTVYFANLTPGYQLLWVEKLEARIGVTSSVLGAMKAIKITNLTSKAGALLNKLREDELNSAKKFRIVSIITATVATVPQLISPVVTFAVYIAIARHNNSNNNEEGSGSSTLTATTMFTSLSLLLLIGEPLFSLFEGMISIMTAIGCLRRVEEFLHRTPREEKRVFLRDTDHAGDIDGRVADGEEAPSSIDGSGGGGSGKVGILIENGKFGWGPSSAETKQGLVLKDIELLVPAGQVTVVVGPVGCGKSTLIKAILGETGILDGKMVLSDQDVAFCDQTPWIMNETIRTNITYASDFDAELYAAVLRSCDLHHDLTAMAKGDMTVAGSKGFLLSAGQRQRVALARAVYSRKKIALLDDVFSQLDASTQTVVARGLLGPEGLFRQWRTTVLLTSSSSRFLSLADQVIALGSDGMITQRGTLRELANVNGYVRNISRDHADDSHEDGQSDSVTRLDDGKENSASSRDGVVITDNDAPQDKSATGPAAAATAVTSSAVDDEVGAADDAKPPETENSIYKYYLSSTKKVDLVSFLFFQTIVAFLACFSYVWLKCWTDDSAEFPYGTSAYYIGVYAVIQTAAMIATGLSTLWCLNALAVATGTQLHATLTKTVMSATLQLFSSTDSGSIMNRFTQDIQLADIQLPLSVLICVGYSLAVIGQAGLIASASGWIALSYPFLFAVFYFIPSYYVRTARQMRTLDLEEKAPIYAQFLESLEGMTTLRAFCWTHASVAHNHVLVDRSQRPWYLMYVIQKWLGVVLDLVIAGLATLVVGLSVGLRDKTTTTSEGSGGGGSQGDAGFTGVSLTQIVSFTSYLKLLILFWAQLQMCMSAVQRIRSFSTETETESEDAVGGDVMAIAAAGNSGSGDAPAESKETATVQGGLAEWPSRGGIMTKNLNAKYKAEDTEFVLKDINLEIKPGEKVCICGRTGSGKSSLVLALFRLLDPTTGSIKIDDIDISTIPRDTVRSRIVGVAEEPFFFPGTVRENMDPWGTPHDDAEIIDALSEVDLWAGAGKLESRGGLDAALNRESLSAGQKQLFNIARALLRDRRVFVFDEVTSSLDVQSEKIVKNIIDTRLAGRTVVAVIHKLAFASGFDKVAVMHGGRIVEFGTPSELLARGRGEIEEDGQGGGRGEGARFRDLCRDQGVLGV